MTRTRCSSAAAGAGSSAWHRAGDRGTRCAPGPGGLPPGTAPGRTRRCRCRRPGTARAAAARPSQSRRRLSATRARWRPGGSGPPGRQSVTRAGEEGADREEEDLEVEPEGPVLAMVVVPSDAVTHRSVTAHAAHLCPAGHSGPDTMAIVVAVERRTGVAGWLGRVGARERRRLPKPAATSSPPAPTSSATSRPWKGLGAPVTVVTITACRSRRARRAAVHGSGTLLALLPPEELRSRDRSVESGVRVGRRFSRGVLASWSWSG
jgi:hypothetical protein